MNIINLDFMHETNSRHSPAIYKTTQDGVPQNSFPPHRGELQWIGRADWVHQSSHNRAQFDALIIPQIHPTISFAYDV